jgi:hypothetical protein
MAAFKPFFVIPATAGIQSLCLPNAADADPDPEPKRRQA